VQIWVPSPSQTLTQKLARFRSQPRSFTPTQARATPTSHRRTPLGTLALSPAEDASPVPLRRLVRGHMLETHGEDEDEDEGGYRSPSPSPVKRNAFGDMMAKARRKEEKERRGKRSAFVEGEAVESDEEAMFGFGERREDGEEEDDEDDGRDIEGLVDDGEMSEEALARQRVLEKVACVPSTFHVLFAAFDIVCVGSTSRRTTRHARRPRAISRRARRGRSASIMASGSTTVRTRTRMRMTASDGGGWRARRRSGGSTGTSWTISVRALGALLFSCL
jgi:hypothetical protein